ncbi:MAG: YhfC family glutamic-type intramembrane protease [Bacillota bacterium]|nr:YhfC family glutamic-type intramembrane protease [Bacillota bacterium]
MDIKTILVALAAIIPFALSLILLIWWKAKTKVRTGVFIIGSICFIVFALGVEQLAHNYFLLGNNAVSNFINGHVVSYALYAALAAGVFEEIARLVAYKFLLRKYKDPAISVAYGIGHGGIEMMILLGFTYAIYFLFMQGVSFGSEEINAQLFATVMSIPNSMIAVAIVERLIALVAQIGLSILVFTAYSRRDYKWFFIAIGFHAILDIPAAFYQTGSLSIVFVEIWCAVIAAVIMYIAVKLYKQLRPAYLAEKEAKQFIAFCGKDCEGCDSFKDLSCTGCRMPGAKSDFCENYCEMRRCGFDKHIETCEDCPDKKRCPAFAQAQENLKKLAEEVN